MAFKKKFRSFKLKRVFGFSLSAFKKMKKVLPILFLYVLSAGTAVAQPDSVLAKEFVQLNANGQFEAAQQYFAPALRPRVSPGMLEVVWKKYMQKYGQYKRVESMNLIRRDSLHTWMTDCLFEKATIRLALTFNPEKQLTGYRINNILPVETSAVRMNETDTAIAVTGGKIAGTLLFPKKKQGNLPVVLIIPGSGPVDRDGNAGMALQTNMYKMLADSLAGHGIASFRYDKRGVGKSAGLVTDESKLRFTDFVNDAVDIIRFLKRDSLFSDVVIIGHSEGSLVGILAAQKADVSGFISLEGAGEPIDKILYKQLSFKKTDTQKQKLRKILDSLQTGEMVNAAQYPVFRPSVQPYLMSWMKYNPAEEIKKLPMPILIVNGTTDLQVDAGQAKKLAAASPAAGISIINGMNHVLKTAPEERAINLGAYNKPDLTLNKELVVAIVSFISSL